jgi:hypothetical protein
MYIIKAQCAFYGINYSPRLVEKLVGFQFSEKNEPCELGIKGRFMNQPIPFGSSTLEGVFNGEANSSLNSLLSTLEKHMPTIRQCGADDIVMHCDVFHDGQCNLEFSSEQMTRIASLSVPFTISCYEDEAQLAGIKSPS